MDLFTKQIKYSIGFISDFFYNPGQDLLMWLNIRV